MSTARRTEMMNLIHAFSGQKNIIPIPRIYIGLTGGDYVKAALLNQILYWSERTDDPNGWFYHSYVEWQDELCLTQYQVTRAIEGDKRTNARTDNKKPVSLRDLGVETLLKKSKKGAPTIHYRINSEVFVPALLAQIELENSIINNVNNPIINNVDKPLSTMSIMDYQQTQQSYTENTTETKAKNTSKKKTHIPSSDGDVSKQDIQSSTDNIDLNVDEPTNNQALILINTYMSYAKSKDVRLKGKGLASARDLVKASITTDDIRDWYQERSKSKWVVDNRNGVPTWWMLTEEIITWRDKRKTKPSALNGNGASKAVEGRYVDKAGATPVTDDAYRKQYGLPDVTQSEVPDFLKE